MITSTSPINASSRILRRRDVQTLTGLARSTIYEMIAVGDFPRPVKIGPRAVGWLESEINQWIADRAGER